MSSIWVGGRAACVALGLLGAAGCAEDDGEKKQTTVDEMCSVSVIAEGLVAPYGVLVESDGYLVTGGGRIDHVDESGDVSTVAELTSPSGSGLVRVNGDLFVLDNPPGKLIAMSPSWTQTVVAESLQNPVDLDLEDDAFIVTDYDNRMGPPGGPAGNNGRLLRVDLDGNVSVIAKKGLGGSGAVSVQPDAYYMADYDGGRLLRVEKDSGEVHEVATGLGNPVGIRFHDGAFYLTDFAGASSGGRLLRITKDGDVKVLDASGLGAAAGLAIQGSDILVTDLVGGRLLRTANCLE